MASRASARTGSGSSSRPLCASGRVLTFHLSAGLAAIAFQELVERDQAAGSSQDAFGDDEVGLFLGEAQIPESLHGLLERNGSPRAPFLDVDDEVGFVLGEALVLACGIPFGCARHGYASRLVFGSFRRSCRHGSCLSFQPITP